MTRFTKLELQKHAPKMRRLALVFGVVGFALFVFTSRAIRSGNGSGVALAQSQRGKEDPVVMKVGNQVLTESDFNEWLVELSASPPDHIGAKQGRENAMPLAILLALAEQGEQDHLNIAEQLNKAMKKKRIELLAYTQLLELQASSHSKSFLTDFASNRHIWLNDDLLAEREAAEAKYNEDLKASGYRVESYERPNLDYSPDILADVVYYMKNPLWGTIVVKGPIERSPCYFDLLRAATICPTEAPPFPSPAEQAQTPEQAINSIRNGPHAAMPPAQTTGKIAGPATNMTITNNTLYMLWVYMTGPMSKTIQIPANGSQSVSLTPGTYQVGANVSNPSVVPFYGEQNYGSGTQYSETFYIGTQP
jgi:hypothetical protein